MKELTQKEFEAQIQRVIDGSIGRKKLAKELETDMRTLNKKIMELSSTNPGLYAQAIEKFPYKPKEIDVDIESLAIYCIIHGDDVAAEKFHISIRTINRKIKKLEQLNPELYELYKNRLKVERNKVSAEEKQKYVYNLSNILEKKESKLENNSITKRKEELEKIISAFEVLVDQGMSKAKAARKLGYDDYPTIWKKYNELERIRTEEKYKKKSKTFREGIKVDISDLVSKQEHSNQQVIDQEKEK